MVDLISIYAQERYEDVHQSENTDSEADSEENEEALNVIFNAFNRNFDNIVAMGFEMEEVEVKYLKNILIYNFSDQVALKASFNNPDQAVSYLVEGIPPSAFAPEENPLAFLRICSNINPTTATYWFIK